MQHQLIKVSASQPSLPPSTATSSGLQSLHSLTYLWLIVTRFSKQVFLSRTYLNQIG
jgi:hypothetical protein